MVVMFQVEVEDGSSIGIIPQHYMASQARRPQIENYEQIKFRDCFQSFISQYFEFLYPLENSIV